MPSFLNFLRESRERLNSKTFKNLTVVLGNEACDLDSAVSCLTYGFLKDFRLQDKNLSLVLPVLNIERRDYTLRKEVRLWLERHEVLPDILNFRDEVVLSAFHDQHALELNLVDHNVLPPSDAALEEDVTFLIDHRPLQRAAATPRNGMILEPVGSCSTLVAEQLLQAEPSPMDALIASLLLGPIILDTVNFSRTAKRVTPKDMEVAAKLESYLESPCQRELVFKSMTEAKKDISDLTLEELLRKDLKVIHGLKITIAISSIPILIKDLIPMYHVTSDALISASESYDVIVLMGSALLEGILVRDLAVTSRSGDLASELCSHLSKCQDALLALKPWSSSPESMHCFDQVNFAASRKVVLPMVNEWENGL